LAQSNFESRTFGLVSNHAEVDFYVVPTKSKIKLQATAYCIKHGMWTNDVKEVKVS